MTFLLAAVAGASVYLLAVRRPAPTMATFVERYLSPSRDHTEPRGLSLSISAGGSMATIGGAFTGLLLSQGDLFLAGRSRSSLALAVLGAAAGYVLWSMRQSGLRERKARRLRFELPIVTDAMSLHIVAGESIAGAVRSIVDETEGVATDELRAVIENHQTGMGLPEALAEASRVTAHADAIRLYDTLSHAHMTGGRLAASLGDLAVDYRSALERDLTAEGGRRAIATYGPILVLMVPTALIFLIYPTLLGLRTLTGSP